MVFIEPSTGVRKYFKCQIVNDVLDAFDRYRRTFGPDTLKLNNEEFYFGIIVIYVPTCSLKCQTALETDAEKFDT